MIKSYGHQTILKTAETVGERLEKGPIFASLHDEDGEPKKMPPFAGEGYYVSFFKLV